MKYSSIALACALAFSGSAWAASPFPSVPYYMQSQKINKTKPNLVFLIDNSVSMQETIDGARDRRPKYMMAQEALVNAFDKYKNKFRWGLAFLNEQEEGFSKCWNEVPGAPGKNALAGNFVTDTKVDTLGGYPALYNRAVRHYVPYTVGSGASQLTRCHLDPKEAITYEKKFTLYGFPGAARGTYFYITGNRLHQINAFGNWYNKERTGGIAVPINGGSKLSDVTSQEQIDKIHQFIYSMGPKGGTPLTSGLRSVYNYMTNADYSFVATEHANQYNNRFNAPGNRMFNPLLEDKAANKDPAKDNRMVMQYRCQKNFVVLISDGQNGQASGGTTGDTCGRYYQDVDGSAKDYARNRQCPWKMAFNKDFRPSNFNLMNKDAEGEDWDDKYFSRQNISTSTIGFGGRHENFRQLQRIADQSGGKHAKADSSVSLAAALATILDNVEVDVPDYVRYDSINFTNPLAVISGNQADSLIPIITIDPDYWSSYIEFKQWDKNSPTGYKQDSNGKDIIAYPITPTQTKRTVLATIPNRNGALYDLYPSLLVDNYLNNDDFNLKQLYAQDAADENEDIIQYDDDGNVKCKEGKNAISKDEDGNEYIDMEKCTPLTKKGTELSKDKWKNGYIPWLAGWSTVADDATANSWDPTPSYRDRSGTSTFSDAANGDMRRHLGDVTRADVAMMGPTIKKEVSPFNASFALPKFMVVQSNDGMVRIYSAADYAGTSKDDKAKNAARPYWERFAYIPGNADRESYKDDQGNEKQSKLLNDLTARAREGYKQGSVQHKYFMSGSVNYYSTPNLADSKKRQRYFFIGLLGQGGKAAYALNVGGKDDVHTNDYVGIDNNAGADDKTVYDRSPNDKTSVPLWDTSTSAFGGAGTGMTGLGYTISGAILGRFALNRDQDGKVAGREAKYVTFLPNGYGYTDGNKPAIYAIDTLGVKYWTDSSSGSDNRVTTKDATPGTLLKKLIIDKADDGAVLGNVSAVDYDGDNFVDALYVGDDHGNLYRVDLRKQWDASDSNKQEYSVAKIFTGDKEHPITAAPTIARVGNLRYVVFGTGRNYLAKDMITSETPKDKIAIQSIYSIRDTAVVPNSGKNQPDITIANRDEYLLPRKLTTIQTTGGSEARGIEAAKPDPNVTPPKPGEEYGWYVDLSIDGAKTGERVTADGVAESIGRAATVWMSAEVTTFQLPQGANLKMCVGNATKNSSWVYQMNAATGLAPSDIYAKRFLNNGQMVFGISSHGDAVNLLTTNPTATNTNGQLLKSGDLEEDPNGGPGGGPGGKPKPPKLPTGCGTESTLVPEPTPGGSSEIVKKCNLAAVRRVSWREISTRYK